MSKRPLIKESNNQEEKSGKKSASKSSIEEEPRIVIKEDMMKKHMPPPFPQALHGKKKSRIHQKFLNQERVTVTKNAFLTEQVSAIIQRRKYVPIILGRPFLATSNAIINCRNGVMQLTFGNMTLELNIFHLCKRHLHPEEEEGFEEYAYLEEDEKCPVVVSSTLTSDQEDSLLGVLRKCKKAIGWQISDLKGISPLVCTHHIYMEEDAKPLVGEPTQVVPKKSGITVIQNEKGEEVSTRPTSGWRVCIDYRRLNSVTRKDHFHCLSWTKSLRESQDILSTVFWMVIRDAKFVWDEKCQKSFEELKQFLTTAPIVRAPNWKLPFEVMCDASDLAMGAVLGKEKMESPISFCLDKFRAYLVGSSIVCFTDHSALKYLLTKQDAKARLIRWILLLQEFNLQIRDKKGVENVVADHLSRLVIAHDSHGLPINDDFPEESLMSIEVAPWYSQLQITWLLEKFQVSGVPRQEHFLLRSMLLLGGAFSLQILCGSNIRKCVPEKSNQEFFPIAMIMHVEDAHLCARDVIGVKGLTSWDHFQCLWTFLHFGGVDYVSKWVEAIPCRSNDHKVVLKFLKRNIFARFGVPKAIISDGGTHFCNKPFETLLAKYGVKHKVVNVNRKDWSIKLLDSLWAYRTAYKTILECLPIALFMAKLSSSSRDEYKAWWAIKKLNMDLTRAGLKRCLDLNELEEMRNDAYLNSKIAKAD
ncbi:Retrovirus-related Pol polyprotein from transposon opus [Vitis vinifera]|uniref:Retrovirus-related Pol polyprotein from transposon opus n=1 Tax=Vitis vinifera TaxID=29760 RepID=A0A438KBJ3_VITVI|nr:Retrovirus-related Pol polyprotein from transposon opus [Vitis vinifera]